MLDNQGLQEAMQKAYHYLARRDCSIMEMKNYLKRKNFAENTIREAINYLENNRYLNDRKYAFKFFDAKINIQQWGKEKIKAALMAKGISRQIINEVLAGYTEHNEYLAAKLQLEKKFKLEEIQANRQKIAGFLKNKGFSVETIRKIFNDYYKT